MRSRTELLVAGWGAITFGAILSSYFVFRPVRDALVLDRNADQIPELFTATFLIALVVSPAWSALLARVPRRRCVPIVFHVFAASSLIFAALVHTETAPLEVGRVFYVWSSVFNMFVVSVFWSLLADLLGPTTAKKLYGPITAGGTLGAIAGPLLTRELVGEIGTSGVLVMSAVLLELGAVTLYQLRRTGERLERLLGTPPHPDVPEPSLRASMRGLVQISRSPYLLGIVGYVLCTATAATFLYLEQASLGKELLATREARTVLFAEIDFWTNLLTFIVQLVVAAPLLRYLGPGLVLAVLPLVQGIGITALVAAPGLMTLMCVQIAARTATHSLTRPAREVLFTVVSPDDKYRAKNAIDTIVYRFGDFASSWLHRALEATGGVALATAAIPLTVVWLGLAAALGVGFRRRAPK